MMTYKNIPMSLELEGATIATFPQRGRAFEVSHERVMREERAASGKLRWDIGNRRKEIPVQISELNYKREPSLGGELWSGVSIVLKEV